MGHPRYGTYRWRQVRKFVMRRDMGLCQIRLPGCRGTATEVDHIVRPEDGGSEYGQDNLRASCKPCNVAKRNMELARRAKRADQKLQRW